MTGMHGRRQILLGLLAVAGILTWRTETVSAWSIQEFRARRVTPETSLTDLSAAPRAYLGREVVFTCRFALRGNLFKDFNTEFNRRDYNNFAVWPADAQLWDPEVRRAITPTLYVPIQDAVLVHTLNDLKRYDLIEVKALVKNEYANLPWMEIKSIRKVEKEGEELKETVLVHIRQGVELESAGKPALAAAQFSLAIAGGLPEAHRGRVQYFLGRNLQNAGRRAEADAALAAALEYEPADAEILMAAARLDLALGRPAQAVERCQAALELNAKDPLIHAVMGEAYGRLGDVRKGLELCQMASELPAATAEQKAMAEVHRARVFTAGQRYAEAVGAYAKAIGLNSPLATQAWLRKEIGAFYEDRFDESGKPGNLEEAITEYRNANALTQNKDAEGLSLLANALFKQCQAANSTDFSSVTEVLDRITAVDPTYAGGLILAGRIAIAQGEPERAAEIYRRLSQENPDDATVVLALAEAYEKLGKIDEAISAYRRSAELAPVSTASWKKLAALLEERGRLAEAANAYGELVALQPKEPVYHYHYARLSLLTGEYARAIEESRKALVAGVQGEQARLLLARALDANGNLRSAEAELKNLLGLNPENAEAAAMRAILLVDLGRSAEALTLARSAASLSGGAVAAQDALGWALYGAGDLTGAVATLSAIPEASRTRAVWYHLGVAAMESGDYGVALTALRQATLPVASGEIEAVANRMIEKAAKLLPDVQQEKKEALRRAREAERAEATLESVPEPAQSAPAAALPAEDAIPSPDLGALDNAISSTELVRQALAAGSSDSQVTNEVEIALEEELPSAVQPVGETGFIPAQILNPAAPAATPSVPEGAAGAQPQASRLTPPSFSTGPEPGADLTEISYRRPVMRERAALASGDEGLTVIEVEKDKARTIHPSQTNEVYIMPEWVE